MSFKFYFMKRFKIALAALILTGGIVAAFAFASKSAHKPFATVTYYYHGNNQYIPPGRTDQEDPRENSLTAATLTAAINWNTTSSVPFSSGNYINAISFDEETTADGGSDGQLTKQEALDALWNYYVAQTPHDLPPNGGVITVGSCTITVYRASSVHS
jgi:hypothetical protein